MNTTFGLSPKQHTEIAFTRTVPSLQMIAVKKLWHENPYAFERLIANYDPIFQDIDYVWSKEREFRKSLYELNATFFGKCICDEINHQTPETLKILLSGEEDFSYFLSDVIEKKWIITKDVTMKETYPEEITVQYATIIAWETIDILDNPELNVEKKESRLRSLTLTESKRRLCDLGLIQRYHDVYVEIEAIGVPMSSLWQTNNFKYINRKLDFDIYQLYYIRQTEYLETKVPMKKTISELKKQILRREFKVYCTTDCFVQDGHTSQDCYSRFDKEFIKQIKELESQ